jgi:hypothetical protein
MRRVLVLCGIAPVRFAMRDALADVFHEPRPARYVDQREYTTAMDA